MAFVVETGEGLESANAYATLAFVDSYHSDRGNTKWAGSDTVKQQAIVRATDYVDKRFRLRFRGYKSKDLQALQWPRYNAVSDNGFWIQGIPELLKKAIAEYSLRALLLGVLAPDPKQLTPSQSNVEDVGNGAETNSGVVQEKQEEVGPIKERTIYASASSVKLNRPSQTVSGLYLPEYPEADMLIEAILDPTNSNRLLRG